MLTSFLWDLAEEASGYWSVGEGAPPHPTPLYSSGLEDRKSKIQLGDIYATVAPGIYCGIREIGIDIITPPRCTVFPTKGLNDPLKGMNIAIVCECVCVCVCVTYVLSNLILFNTIPVADYLRLPNPITIPDIRRLRCLPFYNSNTFHHRIRVLELVSYHLSLQYPPNFFPQRRNQCHQRPIRQI